MPHIIVTAGSSNDVDEGAVMLRERVNASDFESERFAANLLERLGWAVTDATEAEQRQRASTPTEAPAAEPRPEQVSARA